MRRAQKPLSDGPAWTMQDLREYVEVIGEAADEMGLETFPNQIEIVWSEQMIDAYTHHGLPFSYHHWSFGKSHTQQTHSYEHGREHLAYEMICNSNPAISYFMAENDLMTQALVISHALMGHCAYFRNHFLFKEWTHPDAIVDYLNFAREYVAECERKYGYEAVEATLDAAHALACHGVDKYKRPSPLNPVAERLLQKKRMEEQYQEVYELWKTVPQLHPFMKNDVEENKKFPDHPEENLLYFLEKHSPILEDWQREILRIVRKISQHYYPNYVTKMSNEGFASYCHYELLYKLFENGYVTDGFMQGFIDLHTAAVRQPDWNKGGVQLGGLNPYYLGFNIYKDIERMCKEPTKEDEKWFPEVVGKNPIDMVLHAAYNFKDDGLILQYMSPTLMRKMRLFAILDDTTKDYYEVTATSNEDDFKKLRQLLASKYTRESLFPDVQIINADMKGNRKLTLKHYVQNDVPLEEKDKLLVMGYLKDLWGFEIEMTTDMSEPQDADYLYIEI